MKNAGPCCTCRTDIWLPESLYDAAGRSEAISFWCPYGHQQHFRQGETDEQKLQREVNILRQREARLEEEKRQLETDLATEHTAKVKAVASLKRHKIRAAAGTCPCCKRTFNDMARHMKSKHPQFVEQNGNVVSLGKASA